MRAKRNIVPFVMVIVILAQLIFASCANFTVYASEPDSLKAKKQLPSQYCMRDEYIVYAQHQDKHGYCWNFASTMAASTTIMKATGEYYDFSEVWTGISLYNCGGNFSKMGQGGTFTYHYNALKQSGLMLETDLPYQYSYTSSNENAVDYYNFYEKYSNDDLASCLISDADTKFQPEDIDAIKNHIYNHGSIYMSFTFRTGFKESNGAYYLTPNQSNTTSNHAVSVIGWDDDFEREVYLEGSKNPVVYKGAWIILNSYTETNGKDGISLIFYDDENIGVVQGYKYQPDTDKELYFYDKIESGYAYPTSVKGKYYGDFTTETTTTMQKNIFYDDVNLEYSYIISDGADVQDIDIYLDGENVTDSFTVRIDNDKNKFYIARNDAPYGQYKMLVTYGTDEKSDEYLNNFFVTHGLVGEEVEYDYENSKFVFNPSRDLEYYSFISSDKNYVIYTNSLSGNVTFLPTVQSVYSEQNMSIPQLSYEIVNGESCTSTYTIKSGSGYDLKYNFTFEYYEDTSLQVVNVYYDLGGGVNNGKNYSQELASPTKDLVLYAPTREGYTFAGWYLDYGNGSQAVTNRGGTYYVSWDAIHHMGESPTLNASSYYKKYYNNSNTLFVYARWEEEEYYDISLSIKGEGTSQIVKDISIGSNDKVRYLLEPKSGWCLSELTINGRAVSGSELVQIMEHGLVIENPSSDISISATFTEGVYVSLEYGENVKSAYIVSNKDGTIFRNGDVIPPEYFTSAIDRFDPPVIDKLDPISPPKKVAALNDKYTEVNTNEFEERLPVLILPTSGTMFTLVVDVYGDKDGYTYVLDNAASYVVDDNGKFTKSVTIKSNGKFCNVQIGSATKTLLEEVEVKYSVNSHVLDHYISTDINAKGGDKNSGTYKTGQIVYLFIKEPVDNNLYTYSVPSGFSLVGSQWYRMAICVNPAEADLGTIEVKQDFRNYTVTWKNWDNKVIYTEKYRYGDTPVFNYKYSNPSDCPTRPDDGTYTYTFAGWDKAISTVTASVYYTATYEAKLIQYSVSVEAEENGVVTPSEKHYITRLDQKTYVFTPVPGYVIKDVILNGTSIGAVSSYTFSDVCADQTLRVVYERAKHSVNVICNGSGSTDIKDTLTVEYGSDVKVNISPDELFAIDFIKVNGEQVESTNILTINNITSDTVVEIAFKQIKFVVTVFNFENGEFTNTIVNIGDDLNVAFDAGFGYKIKDVIINGVSMGDVDNYTFTSVDDNYTVCLRCEIIPAVFAIVFVSSAILLGIAVILSVEIVKHKRILKQTARSLYDTEDVDEEE